MYIRKFDIFTIPYQGIICQFPFRFFPTDGASQDVLNFPRLWRGWPNWIQPVFSTLRVN